MTAQGHYMAVEHQLGKRRKVLLPAAPAAPAYTKKIKQIVLEWKVKEIVFEWLKKKEKKEKKESDGWSWLEKESDEWSWLEKESDGWSSLEKESDGWSWLEKESSWWSSRSDPEVKWAQRLDKVYVTVTTSDAQNAKLDLEPQGVFTFRNTRKNSTDFFKWPLFDKVNVVESKKITGVRSIFCVIEKAEKKWWKSFLCADVKPPHHYLKVDWDKWVDEDEATGAPDLDTGGMDFSQFVCMPLMVKEDKVEDTEAAAAVERRMEVLQTTWLHLQGRCSKQ